MKTFACELRSVSWPQLPLEDEEGDDAQDNDKSGEHDNVDPVDGMANVKLFEELDRRPVMAVGLRAVQVGPVEAVDGQQGALEAVTHVGHVRQPAQVRWDRVERDEEARKQQNRDRCDRTQVHRRLQFQINSILIQNLHKITKFA